MATVKAVYHALDLLDRPTLAGVMQEQPLPPDTLTLLKVVAGDEGALTDAALATTETPRRIRRASILYVQRVLFAPGAIHYRVLGAERDASQEELRERLALLMRWLHPDRTNNDWESTFAKRVLAAWNALKTEERRRQYDATLPKDLGEGRAGAARRPKLYRPTRRISWISNAPLIPVSSRRRRIGLIALGGAIATIALLVPNWTVAPPLATSAEVDAHLEAVPNPATGSERPDHAPDGQ